MSGHGLRLLERREVGTLEALLKVVYCLNVVQLCIFFAFFLFLLSGLTDLIEFRCLSSTAEKPFLVILQL